MNSTTKIKKNRKNKISQVCNFCKESYKVISNNQNICLNVFNLEVFKEITSDLTLKLTKTLLIQQLNYDDSNQKFENKLKVIKL